MAVESRTNPGDKFIDRTDPVGIIREVTSVTSGRMPTPIDPTLPRGGCSTGNCALFGGSAGSSHRTPPKGQQP